MERRKGTWGGVSAESIEGVFQTFYFFRLFFGSANISADEDLSLLCSPVLIVSSQAQEATSRSFYWSLLPFIICFENLSLLSTKGAILISSL